MIIFVLFSLANQSEFSQFEVDDISFENSEIPYFTDKSPNKFNDSDSELNFVEKEENDYNFNTLKPIKISLGWSDYYVELIFFLFMMLYLLTYLNGRANNSEIAISLLDELRPICQNNFFHLGEDFSGELTQESDNAYFLWCSGHEFIDKCVVYLNLLKRQDLLSSIKQTIRPTFNDTITLLASLNEMDKMVFCISKKDKITEMSKKYPDLAFFCTIKNHDYISNDFACLTENIGLIPIIFDQKILSLFKKVSANVISIHVSNHSVGYSNELSSGSKTTSDMAEILSQSVEKTVSLTFKRDGDTEIALIFELFIQLCDKINKTRLNKEFLIKADKKRERLEEVLIKQIYSKRQEYDQKRKDERRQLELQSIHNDGKASKKLQEREKKKQIRKKQGKVCLVQS